MRFGSLGYIVSANRNLIPIYIVATPPSDVRLDTAVQAPGDRSHHSPMKEHAKPAPVMPPSAAHLADVPRTPEEQPAHHPTERRAERAPEKLPDHPRSPLGGRRMGDHSDGDPRWHQWWGDAAVTGLNDLDALGHFIDSCGLLLEPVESNEEDDEGYGRSRF